MRIACIYSERYMYRHMNRYNHTDNCTLRTRANILQYLSTGDHQHDFSPGRSFLQRTPNTCAPRWSQYVCVCWVCLSVCLSVDEGMNGSMVNGTSPSILVLYERSTGCSSVHTYTRTHTHFMHSFYTLLSFRRVAKTQEHRYMSFRRI